MIRRLCNKAIWLHAGRLMQFDDVDRVLHAYSKNEARPVTENIEATRCRDVVDPAKGRVGVQSEPDRAQPSRKVTMKAVSAGNAFRAGVVLILASLLGYFYFKPVVPDSSSGPHSATVPAPVAQQGLGQNLLWPSEDFTNPNWKPNDLTVEGNASIAPNGQRVASKLVESTGNGRHNIYTVIDGASPAALHTFSVYFKLAERYAIRLELRDDPQTRYGTAMCNPPTVRTEGSVAKTVDVVDGDVESVGNGWYRCWAAMPYDLARVVLAIELIDRNGAHTYKGDGRSGVLIWGAQFEPGTRPTAYVVTTTGPLGKAK